MAELKTVSGDGAGLYVHVPFCRSICPYCDFAVTLAGVERRAEWAHLLRVEARRAEWHGGTFDTLYFGGGTPSSLDPTRTGELLEALRGSLRLQEECKLHFEANPEDLDVATLVAWRRLGFSVISIGVQSFDDGILGALGRRHGGKEAEMVVRRAVDAGFETVSVDLIFGLEGQGADCWRRDLETAVGLGVQHLSCYQLTIEEGSIFGRRKKEGALAEMERDLQCDLYLLAHEILEEHGLEVYEISNFARPGHRSKHNLKYWKGDPYLGLGPSAHSFDGDRRRWWNESKLRRWAARLSSGESAVAGREELDGDQRLLEEVMLGLRLAEGVDFGMLEEKYSRPLLAPNTRLISRLLEEGLAVQEGKSIRLTPRGMAVADGIIRVFDVEGCGDRATGVGARSC